MQETRPADLTPERAKELKKLYQEFFSGKDDADVTKQMDERLNFLETHKDQRLVRRIRVRRNDPCPCNSGRKFKKCCINKIVG